MPRKLSQAEHKRMAQLVDRRGRRKLERILLEGERLVELARELGVQIETIVVNETRPDLLARFHEACVADDKTMSALSTTATAAPIIAAAHRPMPRPLGDATRGILALDGIQDPGNLGALIRIADAHGMAGVVIAAGSADPLSPKVLRGSMGAALVLPVFDVDSLASWLASEQSIGARILLAEAEGGVDPLAVAAATREILVLGSEAHGISKEVQAIPGALKVTLTMTGSVGSLGVSAAGAILIHLLSRRRAPSSMQTQSRGSQPQH